MINQGDDRATHEPSL